MPQVEPEMSETVSRPTRDNRPEALVDLPSDNAKLIREVTKIIETFTPELMAECSALAGSAAWAESIRPRALSNASMSLRPVREDGQGGLRVLVGDLHAKAPHGRRVGDREGVGQERLHAAVGEEGLQDEGQGDVSNIIFIPL